MNDLKTDVLDKYFKNKNITDISFNGKEIFVQDNIKGRYKTDEVIDIKDVENYIKQITYQNNRQFNDEQPILDTEFPNLRINAVHKSISPYGTTVSWRSSVPTLRITKYDENIAPNCVFALLAACIRANTNVEYNDCLVISKKHLDSEINKPCEYWDFENKIYIDITKE